MAAVPVRFAHLAKALLVLAAACFSAENCPAAPAGVRPLWSFHAGAPLSGPPGVGPDGSLAVGTVDGYIHALHADGVFRYSYTVAGRVFGSPVVLDDGVVLAASDKSGLYAIKPDGSLAWETYVAGGVVSPLAVDSSGRIWLRTGSGTALAYSRRGGVVGFAKIGRGMTLGPAPLAGGGVVVASSDELGLIGEFGKFRRLSVAQGLTALRPLGQGFVGLRSGSLTRFDADLGATWARDEVDALLCTSPLVTLEAGTLRWLASDGRVLGDAKATGVVDGASACTASSVFAIDGAGNLVQIRNNGERLRLDAASGRVVGLEASRSGALVAAYQDGRVVALKVVF
jgi:outer membrane protein assembly factor BamB